jgi:beta-glucosidase
MKRKYGRMPSLIAVILLMSAPLASSSPKEDPLIEFAKHPTWKDSCSIPEGIQVGAASCHFQENGAAEHPNTHWGQDYLSNNIHPPYVPDIWDHPERVVEKLKELGMDSFRFSVARDKIEPAPGQFDQSAIDRYVNFVNLLKENHIEPMVTLSHFAEPSYFSWENPKDLSGFVKFAEVISIPLYDAGVRKIVTINEPTVCTFQGFIRGVFPPYHIRDFEGAARVLENMIRTHTKVYWALKNLHSDFEIGLSQDPIRFRNYHKYNPILSPLEKLVCYYLTTFNHTAFFELLQTGKFSLKVPFYTNYSFELESPPPLDFIGLQYYSDPLLNFSPFAASPSVTRVEGENLTSYKYRAYPQGLASALEEFSHLKTPDGSPIPIDLTEIGIDLGLNHDERDLERIQYFGRVFQVIEKAKACGIPVRSIYFWSATGDSLEWAEAFKIRFGLYSFDENTGESKLRPAGAWLQQLLKERKEAPTSKITP